MTAIHPWWQQEFRLVCTGSERSDSDPSLVTARVLLDPSKVTAIHPWWQQEVRLVSTGFKQSDSDPSVVTASLVLDPSKVTAIHPWWQLEFRLVSLKKAMNDWRLPFQVPRLHHKPVSTSNSTPVITIFFLSGWELGDRGAWSFHDIGICGHFLRRF